MIKLHAPLPPKAAHALLVKVWVLRAFLRKLTTENCIGNDYISMRNSTLVPS